MKNPLSSLLPTLTVALSLAFAATLAEASDTVAAEGWSMNGVDPINIYHDGNLVTSYNAGEAEGKPFFYPVIGPAGENVTRDWPMKDGQEDEARDHIHHRGMWYGLGKVNDHDFWHYMGDEKKADKKFGRIRHVAMSEAMISKTDITFTTGSEWLSTSEGEARIMSDERKFRLFYAKNGSLILDATISLIADAGDVQIRDDKEGAWSIRTIPTLRLEGDHAKGSILNSEGVAGKDAWGKKAKWVSYFGPDRSGQQIGIAIFDHPSNPRHPTRWHARHYGLFTANPFGDGFFDESLEKGTGDYLIKNGERVTFRYRNIFHLGSPEEAGIAAAYEEFAERP